MGSHTVVYGDVLYARGALAEGATMLSAKPYKTEAQIRAEAMIDLTKKLQREVAIEAMRQEKSMQMVQRGLWVTLAVAFLMSVIFWLMHTPLPEWVLEKLR
jgi:hypothetical protein